MAKASPRLNRRKVVAQLLQGRGDMLVMPGLGSTTWDVRAAGDNPLNFYSWGGMGGAAMMGLGLALAQPKRRVLVITGDGEMLMGAGALATIAVQQPKNLSIVIIDNERYGETGQQYTHTHFGVDLPGMALAAGFVDARTVRTQAELDEAAPVLTQAVSARVKGPVFATIKVKTDKAPLVLPPRDGTYIKNRFREALTGSIEG